MISTWHIASASRDTAAQDERTHGTGVAPDIPGRIHRLARRRFIGSVTRACRYAPAVALVLGLSLPAFAAPEHTTPGLFNTVLGEDQKICQAYARYLASELASTSSDPSCARSFGPEFPEFKSLSWREFAPHEYPEAAVQAKLYLTYWPWNRLEVQYALKPERYSKELAGTTMNHRNKWLRLWLAEADIDNDGTIESLLKIEDGRCGDPGDGTKPGRWTVQVLVLNPERKQIDTEKTEWILGVTVVPPLRPGGVQGVHETGNQAFDLFQYHGHTYVDRWEETWATPPRQPMTVPQTYDPDHAGLTVYRIAAGKMEAICRFKIKKSY